MKYFLIALSAFNAGGVAFGIATGASVAIIGWAVFATVLCGMCALAEMAGGEVK